MIFRLQDQQKDTWIPFNPVTFKIGGDAYRLTDASCDRELKQVIPASVTPEILKIKLGTACNFRCKYCRQNSYHSDMDYGEQVGAFLSQIRKFNLSDLKRVEYWGGEPLLYWKYIHGLHSALQDWVGHPLDIHLTTNGSLLTEEIVKELLKFDRYIYKLSHDGPGQYLRSQDPLSDEYEKIRELHRVLYQEAKEDPNKEFLINTVLTKNNYNPIPIVEYFQKLFDEDVIVRKMEPAIPYNDRAESWAIIEEDYEDFEETLYYAVAYRNIVKNILEYQQQWTLFQGRLDDKAYRYNPNENKCYAAAVKSLCTDLRGHIVPCQVFEPQDVLLGQIVPTDDPHTHVEWFPREARMHYPASRNEPGFNCLACPVVSMCRGVCSFLPTNDYTRKNCQIRFYTYRALLRAFMKHQFNMDIVDIRPTTPEEDAIWVKTSNVMPVEE